MRFMRSSSEFKQSIIDIVSADPRSVYRKKQGNVTFSLPIDSVDVTVTINNDNDVQVVDVSQTEYVKQLLRNLNIEAEKSHNIEYRLQY